MNRRQFIGISAGVTGALLGGATLSLVRRNLGVGTAGASTPDDDGVVRRAEAAEGRVALVDGTNVDVSVVAREPLTSARVLVVRREYPTGEVLAAERSDVLGLSRPGASTTATVEMPDDGGHTDSWFCEAFLDRFGERPAYLCESAPYRWRGRAEYGAERIDRVVDGLASERREAFVRQRDDNDYVLCFRWQETADLGWRLRYRVRRSVHEAAVARDRGYVRTFEESLRSPVARDLAAAIGEDSVADVSDKSEDRPSEDPSASERFRRLVRFVQDLRYARDGTSTGEYDYNRTVEETLVDGVGDCEDKTHLLAGLLAADPLACESAMLFQSGHVLLGIAAGDVPARFEDRPTLSLGGGEYLPVDPSSDFDVGAFPDAPVVAAYGDGEWLHWDLEAAGRGLDRNVRDWLRWNVSIDG